MGKKPIKNDFVKMRNDILKFGELCDHCLGRQVSLAFKGNPCEKVGAALRAAKTDADIPKNLGKKLRVRETEECFVCGGIFLKLAGLLKKVAEKKKQIEFESFWIGCRLPADILEKEDLLWSRIETKTCEPIKREINRTAGQQLEKLLKKKAVFDSPDVVIILDFVKNRIEFQTSPLFIYGKYKKFVAIPQTRWPCRECGGRGCSKCGGTGKQYQETVEELVAAKVLEKSSGSGSKFHGSGREDINARMLGTGRPFVLEVTDPKRRLLDFKKLGLTINKYARKKIEVSNLRVSTMEEVVRLKAARFEKTYDMIVDCEAEVLESTLRKLSKHFAGLNISQKTPTRVLHRRADKTRKRKIFSVKASLLSHKQFRAIVKTEAGTYVKELVSGDNGRTQPSFSSVLGTACVCSKLDVIKIHESGKGEKK